MQAPGSTRAVAGAIVLQLAAAVSGRITRPAHASAETLHALWESTAGICMFSQLTGFRGDQVASCVMLMHSSARKGAPERSK